MLERQFYKVCQRVIHEKLLSMPNISEMHSLIIFGTWSDSLAMENDLKTLENTIFCVAIPLFFIILQAFLNIRKIYKKIKLSHFSVSK